MSLDTSLLHLPKYRTPVFLFRSRTAFFFSFLRQCGSNIYQQSQRKGLFFFFLKKLTSFQELVCFSLVTLSFEIQPREAIPVEIRTDTRGFDSNAALSPARCLIGADGCRDGTGGAGGQLSAPRPTVSCLRWMSMCLGGGLLAGRESFNLCAFHLMKEVETGLEP